MRISVAQNELSDRAYEERTVEIDEDFAHVRLNELTFSMMREDGRAHYFRIYSEWMRRKVIARKETYLQAFREERVIPNDVDVSEMSSAFQEIISSFTASLPQELSTSLTQHGTIQVIEDARRDIELFGQKMRIEQMRVDVSSNQIHIHGDNYGPIQQGGQGNVQNFMIEDKTK